MRADLVTWDLHEVVEFLRACCPSILGVYLFGSRAYRTNSYRSDFDILVVADKPIPAGEFMESLQERFSPVDLFVTYDNRVAQSLINGSGIHSSAGDVVKMVEGKLLWSQEKGFSDDFQDWKQCTISGHVFVMSILPISRNERAVLNGLDELLRSTGVPNTLLGIDWDEAAKRVAEVIESAVTRLPSLKFKAKKFSGGRLLLESEYDFQNLIDLTLKPWIPTLKREEIQIEFEGQKKLADLSIEHNAFVIEAKYVTDSNSKGGVLKQLDGLKNFYRRNANIRYLLFLILVEQGVEIDDASIETTFSRRSTGKEPGVLVKIIRNNKPD